MPEILMPKSNSIEIGTEQFVFSPKTEQYLERFVVSKHPKKTSVVLINEPHASSLGQFSLLKGLESFFEDNPQLIKDTIFLSEGTEAYKPISVQSLIDEEPHPSDELIRTVLQTFLITGYMAYEWKHQKGIPIIGTEDPLRYDMSRMFGSVVMEKIKQGMTLQDLKNLPYYQQWDFAISVRNKQIAQTLLDSLLSYKNPILFVGAGHMNGMPPVWFKRIKDAAKSGILGPFHQFAHYVDQDLVDTKEAWGINRYLHENKIGYTFLDPRGIDTVTDEDTKAFTSVFSRQREADYEGYFNRY